MIARVRLWDLSEKPYGLTHEFCELKDGMKLHYVLSRPNIETRGKTGLVIFLHGFPGQSSLCNRLILTKSDSWHVWNHFLRDSTLRSSAVLIAVDLPGYGGSDSLDRYDANNVLETLAEFSIKMRDRYLLTDDSASTTNISRGPVVLVAHDWGATIAFRLAAEAPGLADRFVISNSFHPATARANFENRFASMRRMLNTWRKSPTNMRPFWNAFGTVKPVLRQVMKSCYIFVFWLPRPLLADLLARVGDWWLWRLVAAQSVRSKEPLEGAEGWDTMASILGPSMNQCPQGRSTNGSGTVVQRYPYAVTTRAKENRGGYFEKIRLYRENLFFSIWSKSLQTVWELNKLDQQASSLLQSHSPVSGGSTTSDSPSRRRSSVGVFDMGPPGTLGAATTIVWGMKDFAVSHEIAIEGIRDYFGVRPSQVVTLPNAGHWTPLEAKGRQTFIDVVQWAAEGEQKQLAEVVGGNGKIISEM
jgi:pimeloyl-ACP methyl ester carboxylesterase